MAQAISSSNTPILRCRRIWTAATQTIAPAITLMTMNKSPAPEEIAGMPMAKAIRMVRIPTTQASVEAIRTPAGAWAAGVDGFAGREGAGLVMMGSSAAV